jgi:hypothetical protein
MTHIEQTAYSPGTMIKRKDNPSKKGIVLGISMGLDNVAIISPDFIQMDTWSIHNTENTNETLLQSN